MKNIGFMQGRLSPIIDNKIQFVVEGKQILCDHEEIYLSYVARVEDVNSLNLSQL